MSIPRRCWKRIRGLSPGAIILGSALNTLEAVSLGLLIFPPAGQDDAFAGLQTQSVTLFIMSTVISQAVLALGGSSIPCALSSMLAEVLPFMRSIASTIQDDLGQSHPHVLPTTMFVFAMSSIALGLTFLLLAAFRCGSLVGYFPETIMTGVVGAVGVSLFILGLEIPFPFPPPGLSLSTLFSGKHLPLLAASLLPAIFISTIVHLGRRLKSIRSVSEHPLYLPAFCFAMAALFWIVVAAYGKADMATLASSGWLFSVKPQNRRSSTAAAWDYWALFDFAKVEWRVLPATMKDVALLVAVGALSLPIFASAAAVDLDVPEHDMNRDFLGHGIANVLSGAGLALPALMIYSNTRFFERAGGGRDEAIIVTLVMVGIVFASPYILRYAPTVLASALILHIGIELIIEALWQSSQKLIWSEWAVVAGTTIACSAIGFAPGIAVGLAIVFSLHFLCEAFDSRPRITTFCTGKQDTISPTKAPRITLVFDTESSTLPEPDPVTQLFPPVICLSGQVGFADKPIIEQCIKNTLALERSAVSYILLDFHGAVAMETRLAEYLARTTTFLWKQCPAIRLVLAGVEAGSGLQDSLRRGGVNNDCTSEDLPSAESIQPVRCFDAGNPNKALYEYRFHSRAASAQSLYIDQTHSSIRQVVEDLRLYIPSGGKFSRTEMSLGGLFIRKIASGQAAACGRCPLPLTFLVLRGELILQKLHDDPAQPTRQQAIRGACREAIQRLAKNVRGVAMPNNGEEGATSFVCRRLTARQLYDEDLHGFTCVHAVGGPCWILDVDPQNQASLDAVRRVSSSSKKSDY